jgi:hypothetical protein
MIKIEFSGEDKAALSYERYNHPHPFVQRKMEALWLKSQGLAHEEICRLTNVCSTILTDYVRDYQEGGIKALKILAFRRPRSDLEAQPSPHFSSKRKGLGQSAVSANELYEPINQWPQPSFRHVRYEIVEQAALPKRRMGSAFRRVDLQMPIQRAQFATQDLFGDREAVVIEHPLREVDQSPAHDPMDRRDRAGLDHRDERTPLVVIELRGMPGRLAVDEAIRSPQIRPEHPIADGLEPDPSKPSRVRTRASRLFPAEPGLEAPAHRNHRVTK